MQPRGYLTFVVKKWNLITELFEISKEGPIDQSTLVQTLRLYHPETDASALIETFLSYNILSQLFVHQTLYTLGDLIEQIVEHLLNEQQLGLSESIMIHMDQFDKLSFSLLSAVENRDSDSVFRVIKKINRQTQTINRQTLHNYKAIQNIVADSKKRDTVIPIKQRYADILDAWDHYMTPMGEMIDPWGSFDPNTDKVVTRLERAVDILEKSGALITEPENIHIAKQMIIDMRVNIIERFKMSREILQPLYEIARLNSRLSGYEYQLFAIKKELILLDFLMDDETGGPRKTVRTLDQLERHLGLTDVWLKRLKPKQMQDALIGKEITINGTERFSIGVFRLKSMTDKNYRLFINVFKNLLHMNDFNMEDVKMF
ncbi:hypothetical protein [Desulfobacula sp.]|uniref:hypothetical protein n=1 Tax=Desulfobacula sp. TaxID=2593537 RepID=UPI0026036DCB|nr:hypothetical protein [Desulfobacula sp.]